MTDSNNPYAPPRAAVADVFTADGEFQPVKIFSASGRIGRLRYLAYTAGGYLIFIVAVFIAGAIYGAVTRSVAGVELIGWIIAIPYFIFTIMVGIQRCHDMNWSGWAVLLSIIPLAGLVFLFMPGTKGPNRFGPPPVPNSAGVKVLAFALPVLMVVGVIATVVLSRA